MAVDELGKIIWKILFTITKYLNTEKNIEANHSLGNQITITRNGLSLLTCRIEAHDSLYLVLEYNNTNGLSREALDEQIAVSNVENILKNIIEHKEYGVQKLIEVDGIINSHYYYKTYSIDIKSNDYTPYHHDLAKTICEMMDNTMVLDGYSISISKSELVRLEVDVCCSKYALSLTVLKDELNQFEEKALKNILIKISEFCELYSFNIIKAEEENIMYIIHNDSGKVVKTDTVIDAFLKSNQSQSSDDKIVRSNVSRPITVPREPRKNELEKR